MDDEHLSHPLHQSLGPLDTSLPLSRFPKLLHQHFQQTEHERSTREPLDCRPDERRSRVCEARFEERGVGRVEGLDEGRRESGRGDGRHALLVRAFRVRVVGAGAGGRVIVAVLGGSSVGLIHFERLETVREGGFGEVDVEGARVGVLLVVIRAGLDGGRTRADGRRFMLRVASREL
jgi:hypothetical protein